MATAIEYGLIAACISVAVITVASNSPPFKPERPQDKFSQEWEKACSGKSEGTVFVKNENGIDVQMGCPYPKRP